MAESQSQSVEEVKGGAATDRGGGAESAKSQQPENCRLEFRSTWNWTQLGRKESFIGLIEKDAAEARR